MVPESLQQETLAKLHHGHQGIVRCRLRAQNSVWWPGISQRIKDVIEHSSVCVKHSTPHREPLMPIVLPDYPWQSVAMDLFVLNGVNYVVIVDYFSRYPEVIKLRSVSLFRTRIFKNAEGVIQYLFIFCTVPHGSINHP